MVIKVNGAWLLGLVNPVSIFYMASLSDIISNPSLIGAAIGGFFGGPAGASVGASVGGAIGGADEQSKARRRQLAELRRSQQISGRPGP